VFGQAPIYTHVDRKKELATQSPHRQSDKFWLWSVYSSKLLIRFIYIQLPICGKRVVKIQFRTIRPKGIGRSTELAVQFGRFGSNRNLRTEPEHLYGGGLYYFSWRYCGRNREGEGWVFEWGWRAIPAFCVATTELGSGKTGGRVRHDLRTRQGPRHSRKRKEFK
jgi:hypothetical protein